jgi:hypothetical protein
MSSGKAFQQYHALLRMLDKHPVGAKALHITPHGEYEITRRGVINMRGEGEAIEEKDLPFGYRQADSARRLTIEEQLSNSIASAEASNVRLKKLQELQGLLERNKTVARILELQRELGF